MNEGLTLTWPVVTAATGYVVYDGIGRPRMVAYANKSLYWRRRAVLTLVRLKKQYDKRRAGREVLA